MQAMLLSTTYNSTATVLANLHHAFTEVAQKSYHYIRSLPSRKQPGDQLLISMSFLPPPNANPPRCTMIRVQGAVAKQS